MCFRSEKGEVSRVPGWWKRNWANPDKISAVLNMSSPRNVREVQRLTGCLAALGRFISHLADKSLLFFKALKRKEFEWWRGRTGLPAVEAALSNIAQNHINLVGRNTLHLSIGLRIYPQCGACSWKGGSSTSSVVHQPHLSRSRSKIQPD